MSNALAKLTSRQWLREAIGGRAREWIARINFAPATIDRETAGVHHRFYLGNPTGRAWYGTAVDASPELTFVRDHLIQPGAVAFEVGAHHGGGTILLSRWTTHVVAIEPNPENCTILRRNVALNHLENVTIIEAAAASEAGAVTMARASNGSVRTPGRDTITVPSVPLDDIAAELGIVPTLLKIDVEGFEYQVLAGARRILATAPAVMVEVHPMALARYQARFEDLWGMIDIARYDVFMQTNDAEAPRPFVPGSAPRDRVHLFFRPK